LERIYYAAKEIVIDESEEEKQIRQFLNNDQNKYDNVFVFKKEPDGFDLERVVDLTEFYKK
jgi:hypothetical protein